MVRFCLERLSGVLGVHPLTKCLDKEFHVNISLISAYACGLLSARDKQAFYLPAAALSAGGYTRLRKHMFILL